METLQKYEATSIEHVWSDPAEIQRLFAPDLSAAEFSFFMGLSKATGANPFLKEIWAVKYGKEPAQIFHGRDFYRRRAQELPEYEGHTKGAIYENDTFEVVNGIPKHAYTFKSRGRLLAAYCVVYVKNRKVPFMEVVELQEYTTGKSTWRAKPATMLQKVAEAQALRGAFQGVFGATYDESESWKDGQDGQNGTEKPQLEKAYDYIEGLTLEEHPSHTKASLKKWLDVENLRDCKDIDKLRAYARHKKEQADEAAQKEQVDTEATEATGGKDQYYFDLEGKSETVEQNLPDRFEEFLSAADAKDWNRCQAIFDEAVKMFDEAEGKIHANH